MIGLDNSEDMLDLPGKKEYSQGRIFCICCRICGKFELYGTVRAAVSVCDSVNYITEPEELKEDIPAGE